MGIDYMRGKGLKREDASGENEGLKTLCLLNLSLPVARVGITLSVCSSCHTDEEREYKDKD